MNPLSSFVVSPFTNPSGEVVFRVSGWLYGKRIRKNFATRAEAEAERQVFEVGSLQTKDKVRAAITRLSDEQIREAVTAFQRLEGQQQTLSSCVDYALANYRAPERQKLLADAIAEYVAAKEHEFEQDHISRPQLGRIRWDLKRLQNQFPNETVAGLTVPRLVTFLAVGRPAMKTYNNRRGILSTFLKFAFHRSLIADNPILKVPHHRIRRRIGSAGTLSATQTRDLMEHLESFEGGRWVPYFALCLFAGIRPEVPDGEISKLRPEAVDLNVNTIFVPAEVSKIRESRRVAIQPNLAAWLRAYPLERFPIVVADFQKRRAKFAKRFHLTHDVLRHTFISMFVAKFRSMGEAALQAGNSESIIRKYYLDLKTSSEAEEFFNIMPKRAHGIVPAAGAAFPNLKSDMPVVALPRHPRAA
jgi:integrase